MNTRTLDATKFPADPEHGKVVRAFRSWYCSERGYEYWETLILYEDGFSEYTDFEPGDHYDA